LLSHAPRTVLRKQIDQAKQDGFGAACASELEYFIYNDTYETVNTYSSFSSVPRTLSLSSSCC
jgi:glutamine synthetase